MRVLVGCECSQVVVSAFRFIGHDAFSCDLQPCHGDFPEYHFQGDLRDVYNYVRPDLFIAHPPCTYLSRAGLCRLVLPDGSVDPVRYDLGVQARSFFNWCLSRPAPMVCVENPVPIKRYGLPAPSQIIEPWQFGEMYTKCTCLWLRGLPPLPLSVVRCPPGVQSWVMAHRSQYMRSRTFPGVADAMAHAWGSSELVGLQYSLGLF